MLSSLEYIRQSLETHLFFARIMKEHSFFLEIGFTPKDSILSEQADDFRKGFDSLLEEAITLSNGIVSPEVLHSGEVITQYTLAAEKASAYYTGIRIQTSLTEEEKNLMAAADHCRDINNAFIQKVYMLNHRAMDLLEGLIDFKTKLLSNVLSCKLFTVNYPLLIDHILREAKFYFTLIQRLQNQEDFNLEQEALEQELFWNRIMAEHSLFIRGLLDPTENDLIILANNFGYEFDQLTEEARRAMDRTLPLSQVTSESLTATRAIRDFKAQGTQGILECKVKSIIIPLLGDHTLREANHYLRLLESYRR
ncbi:DUF2935 domain-containing protein [Sinanaerobacter chloroacetimidivorans]|uniref:DUF2935 domain-containing protein n=1 Tax=Sinanaerobacter chloroacetimidivorans TaxID=2818044 RepID=A0A8J8AZY0_9FIRM|nr:DUF2935 domain-containing protein [Sinanaerobacter chloroacetimidivorans]MBR0597008.1 DUF2935 domain-containing protein [Sinanaerobacter chloroacetimidivorans]